MGNDDPQKERLVTDDFFDPLPDPPQREQFEPPIWCQPPTDELATLVPQRQVLARTDDGVVLLLSHIDAFGQGCSFRVRASAHCRDEMSDDDWRELHEIMMGGHRFARRRSGGRLPDDLLRFGVCSLRLEGGVLHRPGRRVVVPPSDSPPVRRVLTPAKPPRHRDAACWGHRRAEEPLLELTTATRERLLAQAHLFDDPAAYRAGVLDALEAIRHHPDLTAPTRAA